MPYPEASEDCGNKKELNQEASITKPTEQKTPGAKIDLHGRKLESGSNLGIDGGIVAKGFGMESWPDLSLSNIAKSDEDPLGTEVSNSLSEISKYDTSRGKFFFFPFFLVLSYMSVIYFFLSHESSIG